MKPDGSHFEQSTYYHVYAVDFFVFYYLLAGKPPDLEPAIIRMAEYLHWLLGPARRIAFFGDDDGGRLFHPQGKRDEFGRATLATCGILFNRESWIGSREDIAAQAAWWLGASTLSRARDASNPPIGAKNFARRRNGVPSIRRFLHPVRRRSLRLGRAGHSHADSLSFVVWHNNELVLTDPEPSLTLAIPPIAKSFRGTASHNTVTIDGKSRSQPSTPSAGPISQTSFYIPLPPRPHGGALDAACEYRGFTHRRRLTLDQNHIQILDDISGPEGDHDVHQLWNLGPAAHHINFTFSKPQEEVAAEFSPAYGLKQPARALVVKHQGPLPISLSATLTLS